SHEQIEWVHYPGLQDDPQHELMKKYVPRGAGSIFTFGIKGGHEAANRFIHSVKLLSHVTNIGDSKTLVIHPASTTHARLSPEEQKMTGVSPEQIRISVGLEDIEDLKADINQALRA